MQYNILDGNFAVYVMVVKPDDIEQGKAQLLIEMSDASHEEKSCEYGFVTTGYNWIPIMSDDNQVYLEAAPVVMNPKDPSKKEVKKVLKTIHTVLSLAASRE